MSASTQPAPNNGKKSSNSSAGNTPASTPLTNMSNGQVTAQSSPPPNNNAPKYGTLVPNRIFVGGISSNTTEGELLQLFSSYGTVKAAKIIQDRAGVSKGYGFITFESEDDAKRPLREAENIVLRERKLNIAPAIKKQVSPFSRAFDASSPPAVPPGNPAQFFFPAGATVPYFQGGVAYYHQPASTGPGDPNNQQQAVYQPPPVYPTQTGPPQAASYPSMMFPAQAIYMPQQYPMPIPYDYNYYNNNGASPHQYMHQHQQGGPGAPPCPPMQPSNSPPRPPCYGTAGQQLQGYGAPGDPMFYNMSMYGAATTVEGAPIYTEAAFDIAPGAGPYGPEDMYNLEYDAPPPNCDPNAVPVETVIETTTHIIHHHLPPHAIEQQQQQLAAPLSEGSDTIQAASETLDPGRNTNTPVVSLLSIEQQQEKDISAMQGGRRSKMQPPPPPQQQQQALPPPPPHQHVVYPPNGLIYPYQHPHPHHHHHHQPMNGYAPGLIATYNGNVPYHDGGYRYSGPKPMTNGYKKQRRGGGHNNDNRQQQRSSNEHSSRSSLRTDSNSSASAVDENKNEDKFRTGVTSPPPTAYSPIANQNFVKMGNARNYHNSSYRGGGAYNRPRNHNNNNASVTYTRSPGNNNNDPATNNNHSNPPPSQMVHATTTASFVPPTRRTRRSIRRNQGEMGQGDGPVKSPDDGVAKKMENLKL